MNIVVPHLPMGVVRGQWGEGEGEVPQKGSKAHGPTGNPMFIPKFQVPSSRLAFFVVVALRLWPFLAFGALAR